MKVGAFTYAQLLKAMVPGDLSFQELADATGLHYMTVIEYVREMRKAGVAHVAGWQEDCNGRMNLKCVKLGPCKDVPCPKLTKCERSARYRAKKRAAGLLAITAGRAAATVQKNGRLKIERVEVMA
jgi:hypothetical protein